MDMSKLTQKSQEALQQAQAQAVHRGHTETDGEHLLHRRAARDEQQPDDGREHGDGAERPANDVGAVSLDGGTQSHAQLFGWRHGSKLPPAAMNRNRDGLAAA